MSQLIQSMANKAIQQDCEQSGDASEDRTLLKGMHDSMQNLDERMLRVEANQHTIIRGQQAILDRLGCSLDHDAAG